MSIQYIALIEGFLGSELGVSLDARALRDCGNLSAEQLAFFADQLSAVDAAQHAQMLQVKPSQVLLRSQHTSGQGWAADDDIQPTSAMYTHPYNGLAPTAIDHVKRQLLFFSRIAIHVPELRYGSDLAQKRRNFAEFLNAFIELKPLIEDSSVVLLPHKGFYSNEIEGGAGLVRTACIEDATLREWIASHKSMLDDFAVGARKGDPFFDAGIRICSAIAYGHTLAATDPFVGYLYKLLLSDKPKVNRGRIAATQNIDKIDLPSLGGLNWKDVVAVRRDEDSLRRWRADVAVAISSVDPNLPPEVFIERFDSQVQVQLQRAALELEAALKQSSSMARFKRGAASLVISAIAATTHGALVGALAVWNAVREVAQKEGPKEAIRFMWESREASAKKALRSHYAVFSPTDA